jgi:predicted Ser/Thr protein kinase
LAIGSEIGDYVLVKPLGAGGMGEVWKAYDKPLRRHVALKIMKGDNAEAVERFKREARIVAHMDAHPNIAAVHASGFASGRHFIAMQFVDGHTLKNERLAAPRRAADLMATAARAVGHIHREGGVHRDIKPDNIMLDTTGRLFVMDFGLARPATSGKQDLTIAGMIFGTPAYMPPEQAEGKRATAASDVWSLGATLYDLLTGVPPFKGKNPMDTMRAVREDDIVSLISLSPAVPRDLEAVVMRCLEKKPARRYPDASALADDLDRFLAGDVVGARPVPRFNAARRLLHKHLLEITLIAAAIVSSVAGLWSAIKTKREGARRAAEVAATKDGEATQERERAKLKSELDHLLERAWGIRDIWPDVALTLCRTAQEKAPDAPEAWALEGLLLESKGRHSDAIAALDRALTLKPSDTKARTIRAGAREAIGDLIGAAEDLRVAIGFMSFHDDTRLSLERWATRLESRK